MSEKYQISGLRCNCGYVFESEDMTKGFYKAVKGKKNAVVMVKVNCPNCELVYTIMRSLDKNGKLKPI